MDNKLVHLYYGITATKTLKKQTEKNEKYYNRILFSHRKNKADHYPLYTLNIKIECNCLVYCGCNSCIRMSGVPCSRYICLKVPDVISFTVDFK